MPTTNYEEGVIAWSERQAALLRGGWGELLDIDNIAEEIEDVGKSEKSELQSRHAVLVRPLRRFAGASGAMVAAVRTSLRTVASPDRPAAYADRADACGACPAGARASPTRISSRMSGSMP